MRKELGSPEEKGVTHLGMVPEGMSFFEAIVAARPHRRYAMEDSRDDHRLTICNTLRQAWAEADALPESSQKERILEYMQAATDFAKRMDARMKQLKGRLREHGISVE